MFELFEYFDLCNYFDYCNFANEYISELTCAAAPRRAASGRLAPGAGAESRILRLDLEQERLACPRVMRAHLEKNPHHMAQLWF